MKKNLRLTATVLLSAAALFMTACSSGQNTASSSASSSNQVASSSASPSASARSSVASPSSSPSAAASPTVVEQNQTSAEAENSSAEALSSPSVVAESPIIISAEPSAPVGTVITVPASEEAQATASPSPVQNTRTSEASSPSGTPACSYGQIEIAAAVADGGGAAGSRYINLTFTNTGESPCTISGYPAVNYVDASGNQIGSTASHAAEWTSSGRTLEAGESTTAILRETRANLYDVQSCLPQTAAGYRVTIPGTTSSLVLNFPAEACSGSVAQLSVGQVGAGS